MIVSTTFESALAVPAASRCRCRQVGGARSNGGVAGAIGDGGRVEIDRGRRQRRGVLPGPTV